MSFFQTISMEIANILCPFTLPLWSFQIHDKINDRHQIMVEESWIVGLSLTKEVTILINLSFSYISSPALLQLNLSAEIRHISSWFFLCVSLTFTCFCIYSYTEIIFPFLLPKKRNFLMQEINKERANAWTVFWNLTHLPLHPQHLAILLVLYTVVTDNEKDFINVGILPWIYHIPQM